MVEERAQRASRNHLTDAIAAAGWPTLLPEHRADGDDQPVGRPTCVAAHRLSDRLLLAVVQDDRGRAYPVPLVVEAGTVRRARTGDGAGEALIELLAAGDRVIGGFEVTTWHHAPVTGERAITVDQTNESVIVGEQAVVKWTFLADEGPHPAPSLLAELDRSGFAGMPRPWGTVQWSPPDGSAPRLVAAVAGFAPGAEDGWTWTVGDIRAAVEQGTTPGHEAGQAVAAGRAVGDLIASFHRALAGTARRSTAEEVAAWRTGAVADLDRALEVTTGRTHEILREHEADIRSVFAAMPADSTPVIRVHGDLHVGQVLRSSHGSHEHPGGHRLAAASYLLTDFDGNPVVPPADRIREQPAAVDVAGMAQSFVHAGLVVARHNPTLDADRVLETALATRSAFLDAYRSGSGSGQHGELLDERLLPPFALRQVCREFVYAATHLPRWSYVPEQALPLLLSIGPDEESL